MSKNTDVKPKKGRKPKVENKVPVQKKNNTEIVNKSSIKESENIDSDEERGEMDLKNISEDDFASSLIAKAELFRGMNVNINKLPDELLFSYIEQLIKLRLHKIQKQNINTHIWEDIFGAIQLIRIQKDFYKIFLLVFVLNIIDKPSNRYLNDIVKFFIYVYRSLNEEFADTLEKKLHYCDHITQMMFLVNKWFGKFFMIEVYKQNMVAADESNKTFKYRKFNYIDKLTLDMINMVNNKEEAFNNFKKEYLEDYPHVHKQFPNILERIESFTKNDLFLLEFSYCCEYIPYAMDIVLKKMCINQS